MTGTMKNLLCIVAFATTIALPFGASAQSSDAVREKCIADARAAYPDDIRFEHQTARRQLYINCMEKAGLTP
jgi:hypothetical protein